VHHIYVKQLLTDNTFIFITSPVMERHCWYRCCYRYFSHFIF